MAGVTGRGEAAGAPGYLPGYGHGPGSAATVNPAGVAADTEASCSTGSRVT
jgi:hypothetical protein